MDLGIPPDSPSHSLHPAIEGTGKRRAHESVVDGSPARALLRHGVSRRIRAGSSALRRLRGRIERTRGKRPHRGLAVIADAANPFVNLVGQPHGGTSPVARRRHAAIGAAGVNRRAAQADDAHKFREPHEAAVFGFCQGRSKFGPLRRSKSRPVGEGVAVFVGRLERSLRSPFRAAQA